MSGYLVRLIGNYLSDRIVDEMGGNGEMVLRELCCGVSEGSVLGPLLWALAYDSILRGNLPQSTRLVYFADDILILADGRSWGEATVLAEREGNWVADRISHLGLTVSASKTEVIGFRAAWAHRPPRGTCANIHGAEIPVGER